MSRSEVIDAFRGLTLLEMQTTEISDSLFFDHASYDEMKMSYADTIFPGFAFISGMTIKPGKVIPLRKSIQVIGLGMCYNSIPLFVFGQKLRLLGVLQRHGLSAAILNNFVPLKLRDSVAFPFVMTSLWCFISFFSAGNRKNPFSVQETTAQQKIDGKIFGDRTYHDNFDPEGLLGALMTSVTIWSGYWFSRLNLSVGNLILLGLGLLGLAEVLSRIFPSYFPISKPLWSPTFAMASSGWTILKYGIFRCLLPYFPRIVRALGTFGSQSMEIYFLGEILLVLLKYRPQMGLSFWDMCRTSLEKWMPKAVVSTLMVAVFDAILVVSSLVLKRYNLKIRLV